MIYTISVNVLCFGDSIHVQDNTNVTGDYNGNLESMELL
jgi:hypothetical protein